MISLLFTLNAVETSVVQLVAPSSVPTPLLDGVFWMAAAACAVAQYFIVRAVWKVIPAGTGSPHVPVPRRAQEILWVLLPVLLLLGAFAGAWRQLHPPVSPASNPSTNSGAPDSAAPDSAAPRA